MTFWRVFLISKALLERDTLDTCHHYLPITQQPDTFPKVAALIYTLFSETTCFLVVPRTASQSHPHLQRSHCGNLLWGIRTRNLALIAFAAGRWLDLSSQGCVYLPSIFRAFNCLLFAFAGLATRQCVFCTAYTCLGVEHTCNKEFRY